MKIFAQLRQPGFRSQLAVAASLLLLLPLLAVLQYVWLGQLSAKEREHMQTTLRAATAHFSQDFNQEITRAYMAFLPTPNWQEPQGLSTLIESYERWREATAFPKLVKAIYVMTAEDEKPSHLMRLDIESKHFTSVVWPEEMGPIRKQVQHYVTTMQHLATMASTPDALTRPPMLPAMNGDAPALILPLIESPKTQANGKFTVLVCSSQFLVVALDTRCLQQEVLPTLIQRHFTEGGQLSYELAIVNRRTPPQVIYQTGWSTSSVDTGWDYTQADASASLFAMEMNEARRWWHGKMQYLGLGNTVAFGVRENNKEPKQVEHRVPSLHFPPLFTVATDGPTSEQPGAWQIYLRHRAGSLEAAVGSMRRRNLLISFSILLLLAASVSLLLVSTQRARRLAQQQMDFVAGISHELHTPIAVIDSAGYNLAKGVMKSPEQIKKYGLLIRKETRQLTEIVEQVLEFAGLQAHQQRYDLLPTSIHRVIEDVLASSQPLLDEGGFQVEKEWSCDLPMVMADALALSRAIQNLLSNAMKYGGESHWIGLQVKTVPEGQEPSVQITISDHGLGIPAAELPHIFQPFYRGNEARAAQIRGNGLGLSLVKQIIEAHGGSVSVQSEPGVGSAFTLSLPVTISASYQPSAVNRQLGAEPMPLNAEH